MLRTATACASNTLTVSRPSPTSDSLPLRPTLPLNTPNMENSTYSLLGILGFAPIAVVKIMQVSI